MSINKELEAFTAGIRASMADVDAFTKDVQLAERIGREMRAPLEQIATQMPAVVRPATLDIIDGLRREAEAMNRVFEAARAITVTTTHIYPRRRRA